MVAAIEFGKLAQVVWVSLVAGVGVSALFSLMIYGSTRAVECRRAGNRASAGAFGALTVLAGLAFAGLIVFAISIILSK